MPFTLEKLWGKVKEIKVAGIQKNKLDDSPQLCKKEKKDLLGGWTTLKNMFVNLEIFPKDRGENK